MSHFIAVANALETYELDGILITSPANRLYVTGFPSTDGIAFVTRDARIFITDSRYTEAAEQTITDGTVIALPRGKSYETMVRELTERFSVQALGFEEGEMTVAQYQRYTQTAPCSFVATQRLLTGLRASKDGEELAKMKQAQRIAERALEEVLPQIRPGVTELDIAAELTYRMMRGGAAKNSFDPIVVSGAKSSLPHGVPSGKKIASGDFVTMDFGCIYEGYCSDMTRTVAVGSVTAEMKRVYDCVLAAQKAGIAAARAGVAGRTIDAAARQVIEAAGYGAYFGHGFGHSLGVEIHESPNCNLSGEALMPAGAVVSAEPGIYLPGKFGVRIEDVLYLTPEGNENLTRAPKELLILA